jgi:hypothetical protein
MGKYKLQNGLSYKLTCIALGIRYKIIGDWKKLHSEQLHKFYSSPIITIMIKSSRITWAGQQHECGRRGMHVGYWWESQKERNHKEDIDIGRRMILKYIIDK